MKLELGGRGAPLDPLEDVILAEEFARAGVSMGMQNQGISMFVPTLLHYGSQRATANVQSRLKWNSSAAST